MYGFNKRIKRNKIYILNHTFEYVYKLLNNSVFHYLFAILNPLKNHKYNKFKYLLF